MPRPIARLAIAFTTIALWLGLLAATAHAADGVTMTARPLLGGHARVGSWVAIAVDLTNGGPPVTGELRLAAGVSGTTRFSVPVDLPTQSAKTYVIHAQSPSFGGKLTVSLVTPAGVIAEAPVAITVHDPSSARRRHRRRAGPGPGSRVPRPGRPDHDRAERRRAHAGRPAGPRRGLVGSRSAGLAGRRDRRALDRPDRRPGGLGRGWGSARRSSAGPPGRPSCRPCRTSCCRIGRRRPSMSRRRPSARSSGSRRRGRPTWPVWLVRLPTAARSRPGRRPGRSPRSAVRLGRRHDRRGRCRRSAGSRRFRDRGPLAPAACPALGRAGATLADDSNLLNAVSQLPALALPPIGGLLALLAGYIILVGPVNYLVLRRIDRREWAWVSIPLLIVGFTVGAYGIGRRAPRQRRHRPRGLDRPRRRVTAGRGTSLVYAGVFSPSRRTYQVERARAGPSSRRRSTATSSAAIPGRRLDIVQGEPSRIRDLAVGFGSLRTIRAETPVAVPTLEADLRLEGDTVVGSLRNTSTCGIDKPSLVLGANVQTWPRLGPGASVDVRLPLAAEQFGTMLSTSVVGQQFFADGQRRMTRRLGRRSVAALIDSLTIDPSFGLLGRPSVATAWSCSAGPMSRSCRSISSDQRPRIGVDGPVRDPLPLHASGDVAYRDDMVRSTVVSRNAPSSTRTRPTWRWARAR